MDQKMPSGKIDTQHNKMETFKKALLLKTLLLKTVLIKEENPPRVVYQASQRLPCGINHHGLNVVRMESGSLGSKWRKLIQRNCSIDSTKCILPRQFKYRL